ncbi:hypothetical protein BCL76_102378 [Streptomyces sp. CG 926]|uniref:hypothetical protein n=1 Tax=Streptomyces sp. CG 926 TaxID=1882405 RepID=UPI000D6B4018|nr:hypothetical protein [Streptomyces sp. CG 926]PWK73353.1 hypothetical protein BCL76_102378 [Streptomyces sp. CG 926]
MIDIDLEPLVELVRLATRFEHPWNEERITSELLRSGWKAVGSVSLPYPQRLGRNGLLLGAECDEDPAYIGVTLKEWQPDFNSPDYLRAIREGYEDEIRDSQELAGRFSALLGESLSVDPEELILDSDEFFFVHTECWKVDNVHVVLGLEHLSSDDTAITVSLYVISGTDAQ